MKNEVRGAYGCGLAVIAFLIGLTVFALFKNAAAVVTWERVRRRYAGYRTRGRVLWVVGLLLYGVAYLTKVDAVWWAAWSAFGLNIIDGLVMLGLYRQYARGLKHG
jgi:hypothetical protein